MFSRIYKMRIKYYFREKSMVFWLIAFPIILATLFNVALRGVLDGEKLETVNVAVVVEQDKDSQLTATMREALSDIEFFQVQYIEASEAEQRLEEGSIDGIIYISAGDMQIEKVSADDMQEEGISADGMQAGDISATDIPFKVSLKIKENGMPQTILKETVDIIKRNIAVTFDLMSLGAAQQNISKEVESFMKNGLEQENEPDMVVTFFYTVLGMACAYGAMTGVNDTEHLQANLSAQGMRQAVSPVPKMTQILAYFAASGTAQCISLTIVFVYIRYILGISFGDRLGLVILTTYIGAVAHVALGTFVGVLIKKSTDMKIGIVLGYSMIGSFLAGMMSNEVKYAVYRNAPVVNYINTVNLVCDSYNKLYYYPGIKEYAINISILTVIGLLCFIGAVSILRRQKYS